MKVNLIQSARLFVTLLILLYNCAVVPVKLKACIVDDESLAIAALRVDLNKHCPEIELLAEFQNPENALEFLMQHPVDILFLDIEMPEYSGMELLEKMGNFNFDVIFTTAYSEYALQAIKLHASDYLLKPIDTHDLKKSVASIYSKRINLQKDKPVKIALADMNGIEIIDIDKVLYCLADKNYTSFFLTDNRKIIVSKNIGEYEKLLDPSKFFRIHQSSIVNIYKVSKIVKGENGGVIMEDGTELSISRSNRKDFIETIQRIALM